ncbi:MAG: TaqI-like C-terminal specificity domain-containing protein, partial [Ginsengibacter sp.]
VYKHLQFYKKKLSSRNKAETGIRYEWYVLQRWAANYYKDFLKPKIIYPNMTKFLPFVYDKHQFFTNQKCFIITGNSLAYLTAFFNSKIFRFAYKEFFPELLGDTRELSKVFFEMVAVKEVDEETNIQFEKLINDVIDLKSKGLPSTIIEKKIQNELAEIYLLSENDITLIESSENGTIPALPEMTALSESVNP